MTTAIEILHEYDEATHVPRGVYAMPVAGKVTALEILADVATAFFREKGRYPVAFFTTWTWPA